MSVTIRPMTESDYPEALALWRACEGIGLSDADSAEAVAAFLARNPGLALVAREGATLAGAVLCGHDGRRGYIYHLAVAKAYRRRGVGRALAERCLGSLRALGIRKCHLFVFASNADALTFWQRAGWQAREDLCILSQATDERG